MTILNEVSIEALNSRFADAEPRSILEHSVLNLFKNKIAYVCSFGTESAIILHLIKVQIMLHLVLYINLLQKKNKPLIQKI